MEEFGGKSKELGAFLRINGLQFESVPEEEKRELLLKLKNSTPHQVKR